MKTKKRRPMKWIILAVIVLVLAAGMLRKPSDGALYVEAQVTRGDVSTTYSFTGSLAARHTQTAVAMANDRVKDVYVEGNQQVEKGDRLIRLMSGEVAV